MAAEADICNLALAHLGDEASVSSISPPEGSAQAEHCARFYPVARDALLEMHPWGFAVQRLFLPNVEPVPGRWRYAYRAPANVIRFLSVGTEEESTQAFTVEADHLGNTLLLSDVPNALLHAVMRVTDTTRFPPLFVHALSWLLASFLAGPLMRGNEGVRAVQASYQMFQVAYREATISDARQHRVSPHHTVSWMAQR